MNTNGHNGNHGVEDVTQHVDRASEAAQQFYSEAREGVQSLAEVVDLKGRFERNPYGMIAAGLGIGYLLGGGLLSPTTGRLFRIGLKIAAIPMIRNELFSYAENAIDGVLDRSRNSNQGASVPPTNRE